MYLGTDAVWPTRSRHQLIQIRGKIVKFISFGMFGAVIVKKANIEYFFPKYTFYFGYRITI